MNKILVYSLVKKIMWKIGIDQEFSKNGWNHFITGLYSIFFKKKEINKSIWMNIIFNTRQFLKISSETTNICLILKKRYFEFVLVKYECWNAEFFFLASTNSNYDENKVKVMIFAMLGWNRNLTFDAKTKMLEKGRFWVCARKVWVREYWKCGSCEHKLQLDWKWGQKTIC